LQSAFLAPPTKSAEALDFTAASQGVLSASVSCGVNNLLQRNLSSKLGGLIEGEALSEVSGAASVQVGDREVRRQQEALTFKETCLKKIARAASQVVLREITRQTVNWINTGFNGQPLFVRNPQSFFKSLADREVQRLTSTFRNRNNYPFGQSFIRGYVRATQRTFEQNSVYSLRNSLGGYTPQQFYSDFNLGGWDGWLAMTQQPQNNPIGFSIEASRELSRRLAGTQQSVAQDIRDELQQGMGFLSPKVCVDPVGYIPPSGAVISITEVENLALNDPISLINQMGITPEQAAAAIGVSVADLQDLNEEQIASLIGAAQTAGYDQYVDQCRRYETTTPGGVVSSQLTKVLNIPTDNLLLAPEDLDSSLQAVFDALLNQLFKKGLASLSDLSNGDTGGTGASNIEVYSGGGYGSNASATQNFSATTNVNDQWFNQNRQFDITNIASIQEIIDTQNEYIQAIIDDPAIESPLPNPTINSANYPLPAVLYTSAKGQNYWLNRIIPEIYQLDYCIPGPHPGWENEAQANFFAIKSKITDTKNLNETALGRIYDTFTFGLGTSVINFWTNVATPGDVNADDLKHIRYYGALIQNLTGIQAEADKYILSYEKVIKILDTLFERFVVQMNRQFDPVNLPSSAGEAALLYAKIPGYTSILQKNTQDIVSLRGVVRRLEEIKQEITLINTEQATLDSQTLSGAISQSQAEIIQNQLDNRLDFAKRSFGNQAQNFVTDANTLAIKDQTRQLISDIVYIHNTLLKGPSGCEAQIQFVPVESRVRAWPYQNPHYYDYPKGGSGTTLVDIGSLKLDPITNNLIGAPLRSYTTYYPFMEYSYFGNSNWSGYRPTWSQIYITDLMNFDTGEVGNTVGIFEARLMFGE
jgi:hypothetical protein